MSLSITIMENTSLRAITDSRMSLETSLKRYVEYVIAKKGRERSYFLRRIFTFYYFIIVR